ncbi:hypothetical protein G7074_25870 [Pedobacter sp. HDW13]|uniref:hypothetical protein n=1 Tax=Pedobacter sp. HDW13 TaxID=2714940 RepID=UPI00140AE123|nr:hypothetical protein [Pedobacter sp. HDW13]QIL42387.1 hypothetical protein G7074_25870 [Pedobacter sp. HDW13]
MKQTIYFNFIYVIESLGAGEVKTGTNIYNDVLRYKVKLHEGFGTQLLPVANKVEFIAALNEICERTGPLSHRPYLHLEIHGNRAGLGINNGELITWDELYSLLVRINEKLQNQLFLSLATCYGAYLFNAISPFNRSPFFGFVGNVQKIPSGEIEYAFSEYFSALLEKLDLDEALLALNAANPNAPFPCISLTSNALYNLICEKLNAKENVRSVKLAIRKRVEKKYKAISKNKSQYSKAELREKIKAHHYLRARSLIQQGAYFRFESDHKVLYE